MGAASSIQHNATEGTLHPFHTALQSASGGASKLASFSLRSHEAIMSVARTLYLLPGPMTRARKSKNQSFISLDRNWSPVDYVRYADLR